jgi:hypothetical protein
VSTPFRHKRLQLLKVYKLEVERRTPTTVEMPSDLRGAMLIETVAIPATTFCNVILQQQSLSLAPVTAK